MHVRCRAAVTLAMIPWLASCAGGADQPTATPAASTAAAPSPTAPSVSATSISPTASAIAAAVRLSIVVDDGAGSTTTWTLTCTPAGGDHPQPERACQALATHRAALLPVPRDRECAPVYGGPGTATITGTWHGDDLVAVLARTDACEIARWDALVPLVPSRGR